MSNWKWPSAWVGISIILVIQVTNHWRKEADRGRERANKIEADHGLRDQTENSTWRPAQVKSHSVRSRASQPVESFDADAQATPVPALASVFRQMYTGQITAHMASNVLCVHCLQPQTQTRMIDIALIGHPMAGQLTDGTRIAFEGCDAGIYQVRSSTGALRTLQKVIYAAPTRRPPALFHSSLDDPPTTSYRRLK